MRSIDSSSQIKFGAYIANVLNETIEEVGPKNVVQVVMDNAKIVKQLVTWLISATHTSSQMVVLHIV